MRRLAGEDLAELQNMQLGEFYSVEQLPRFVHRLTSPAFWSDSRSRCPFVHILRKSLPQRCQVSQHSPPFISYVLY